MSEIRDYDNALLENIRHIEDVNTKFALQNYAAAGAVFLAKFTHQIPLGLATLVIVAVGFVFTGTIWFNVQRYKLFWKMHRIVRDSWLAGQTPLATALRADRDCNRYLGLTAPPSLAFLPAYVINLLPALAALLLFIWR
jgi:hypothetical protein